MWPTRDQWQVWQHFINPIMFPQSVREALSAFAHSVDAAEFSQLRPAAAAATGLSAVVRLIPIFAFFC
jgi:hypothetical protein